MAKVKTVSELPRLAVEVLRWVIDFHKRMGYMPTMREIQLAFGMGSTNGPRYYLAMLVARGYVVRSGQHRAARTMRVTESGHRAARGVRYGRD